MGGYLKGHPMPDAVCFCTSHGLHSSLAQDSPNNHIHLCQLYKTLVPPTAHMLPCSIVAFPSQQRESGSITIGLVLTWDLVNLYCCTRTDIFHLYYSLEKSTELYKLKPIKTRGGRCFRHRSILLDNTPVFGIGYYSNWVASSSLTGVGIMVSDVSWPVCCGVLWCGVLKQIKQPAWP